MRTRSLRGLVSAGALLVTGTALLLQATPASASTTQITAVGSDTTQNVMSALTFSPRINNVFAGATTGGVAANATTCVGGVTFSASNPAPNGSGAGKAALAAEISGPANRKGCYDVARSSSSPSSTDPSSFQYYAYGLDAVTWAADQTGHGGDAPASLTLAQLQSIYHCGVTNWSSVGGKSAPIVRYYPQTGSGTATFFASSVLGFDPRTSLGSCTTAPKTTEENTTSTIVANGNTLDAIVPFSVAQWVAQANKAGKALAIQPGQISGKSYLTKTSATTWAPNPSVVNEANESFLHPTSSVKGIRYIYNVVSTQLPTYTTSRGLIGFVNATGGGTGQLCSGSHASTISSFGFVPLNTTVSSNNRAGSHCRLVP
jgi:phosphate transport system substrate-binding protein